MGVCGEMRERKKKEVKDKTTDKKSDESKKDETKKDKDKNENNKNYITGLKISTKKNIVIHNKKKNKKCP